MLRRCLSRRGFLAAALSASEGGVQGWQDDERYSVSALASDSAFARIPAGDFVMGSATGPEDERPPHRVRISRAFELSRFEITQSQWKSVMTDPHHARLRPEHQGEDATDSPSQFKGASLPVDSVSWYDVQLFVARLSAFSEKYTYRLPTEAEWEYTCRAGQHESRDPMRLWRGSKKKVARARTQSARHRRTHGAYTTCSETSPSGFRIGTSLTTTKGAQGKIRKAPARDRTAYSVAEVGWTPARTPDRRRGFSSFRSADFITWDFELCGCRAECRALDPGIKNAG